MWPNCLREPSDQVLGSSQRAAEGRVRVPFLGKLSPVEADSPLRLANIFSAVCSPQ